LLPDVFCHSFLPFLWDAGDISVWLLRDEWGIFGMEGLNLMRKVQVRQKLIEAKVSSIAMDFVLLPKEAKRVSRGGKKM
jgi:hypothetical protein